MSTVHLSGLATRQRIFSLSIENLKKIVNNSVPMSWIILKNKPLYINNSTKSKTVSCYLWKELFINRYIFFLYQKRARFHITLLIIAFFMYFFYGEFVYFLSMLPMKKKKRRYWINLYLFSLSLMVVITLYKKRSSIRRFLGMNWTFSTVD